jgi:hypothetical protein
MPKKSIFDEGGLIGNTSSYLLNFSPGEQEYTSANTYTWTAPAGVSSVCVVCVGGGGGGGGSGQDAGSGGGGRGLGYKNNIPV